MPNAKDGNETWTLIVIHAASPKYQHCRTARLWMDKLVNAYLNTFTDMLVKES